MACFDSQIILFFNKIDIDLIEFLCYISKKIKKGFEMGKLSKDKIITFRLSNNDLLILKSKCEDKNIKLSTVIRNALFDYLNRI